MNTRMTMMHVPSGHGKGKWETKRGLRRYKMKRLKLNRIAGESRRRNRT